MVVPAESSLATCRTQPSIEEPTNSPKVQDSGLKPFPLLQSHASSSVDAADAEDVMKNGRSSFELPPRTRRFTAGQSDSDPLDEPQQKRNSLPGKIIRSLELNLVPIGELYTGN